MDEIWKDIPGYEGRYQVSDMGQVKALPRTDTRGRNWPEQAIKPMLHTHGYLQVSLTRRGVKTRKYIHHLVMDAFVGRCPNDQERNHINGNKTDNRLTNLEYCTRSANHFHAYRTLGKQAPKGEQHHNAKLTAEAVLQIREMYAGNQFTQKQLAARFGVSPTAIQQVLNGQRWSHK